MALRVGPGSAIQLKPALGADWRDGDARYRVCRYRRPAIQPASATLAGLQAEATIQAIQGQHPLGFKPMTLDVRTGEQHLYGLARNPTCEGIHARLDGEPAQLEHEAYRVADHLRRRQRGVDDRQRSELLGGKLERRLRVRVIGHLRLRPVTTVKIQ